jgi:hypothetical protein
MSLDNPLPSSYPSPAQQLANNLDAIHQSGNGYMDIPAQVAVAAGGQDQTTTLSIIGKIKNAITSNKNSVESYFSDPQHSSIPSVAHQLTTAVTSHIGNAPIMEDHVTKIQQDMIKAGVAPIGSIANGVWDTTWTNAMANANNAALTKPTVGNAPPKSTVQHTLTALSQSRNTNVIVQIVKALPREILNLMGDVVSGKSLATPITGLLAGNNLVGAGRAISQAGAKPENRTTNAEFAKQAASGGQLVQDIGTFLTFMPMAKGILGLKEAGAIAKSGKVLTAAEVAPKYTFLNSIVASAQKGEIGLMQPSARALINKPILNTIYKGAAQAIAKTAPAQMAIRDTLAQRLRLPIIRAANTAGMAILGTGLKEQGIALGESKLGGRQGALDTTVYGLAPISGKLANVLDIFSIQMNPGGVARTGAKDILGATGKTAETIRNTMDDLGILRGFQKANPQLDYPALLADHIANGGKEIDVLKYIGQQFNDIAMNHAIDLEKNPLILDGTWMTMSGPEKEAWALETKKSIYQGAIDKTDTRLADSQQHLIADQNAIETGFRDIGATAMGDVRASAIARKGESNLGNLINAQSILEPLINDPELVQHFLTSAAIENGALPEGAVGLMRAEGLTKTGAKQLYDKLFQQLQEADTPELKQLNKIKIGEALIKEFGVNVYKLGSHDPLDMLGTFESEMNKLAADLYVNRNAPQEVKDAIAKINALGYKPVYGDQIGHIFTKGLQYTDLGAADFSKTAKIARKLGVSPRLSSSQAVSARTEVEMNREGQARIDAGKITPPPGFNFQRVLTYLRDNLPENTKLTLGQTAVLEAAKAHGNYDIPIAKLISENPGLSKDEAWNLIKKAKKTELGLREIDPSVLRNILTKPLPNEITNVMGLEKGTQFMDVKSANQTIQAIWKARVNVPLEMIGGAAKLEDILYSGLGIGKIPWTGKNAMTLAEIPSKLMNLRSRVRYQESIVFAYRRMAKTMLKGITEDIPPVMYPEAKMQEMGIAKKADALYQRIFPEKQLQNAFMDDSERVVNEADFYNLYSPREFEKWSAYWLSKQGYSDAEIAKKVENVMGYGERTAAERSLNAVFFPFSFNKTVMRQGGAFLLTHPGQRLVVQGIINLYDQVDGPKYRKWVEDNLPLIKQIEQLNALEHGVGLGQFGGINAPYLGALFTLLGPKTINYGTQSANDLTLKKLKQYIPMVKEFSDLFLGTPTKGSLFNGQIPDTVKTTLSLFQTHAAETDWHPNRHNLMPVAAQQTAAWDYRTRLISGLNKILAYNYQNPDNRVVWPDWVPTESGLAGHPITKASIGELVHYKYPAWDNAQSAVISQQKATEADRFIGEVTAKNPTLGTEYRKFEDAAKKVSDSVNKDSVPLANLAKLTDIFRAVAIGLATKDSNFAAFYKTHYQRLFGPLEGLK